MFLGAVIVVNGGVKCLLTHQSSVGNGGSVVVAENGGGGEKGWRWRKKKVVVVVQCRHRCSHTPIICICNKDQLVYKKEEKKLT